MDTPLKDKWLRIIGIPIVAILSGLVLHSDQLLGVHSSGFIPRYMAVALTITILIWEGSRAIHLYFRRRFPRFEQNKIRLLSEAVVMLAYASVFNLAFFFFDNWIGISRDSLTFWGIATHCFGFSTAVTLFLTVVYESRYFLGQWERNIRETETLARAHLQSRFEALKKQLDPHFLFNSLNTLAHLIEPDNEPAQEYLEKLSDVYRYVLDTREKSTVTLREELLFLDAFLFLISVRFRENILVERDLPDSALDFRIPALGLQILVENAIKHNEISRDNPLHIRIFLENDRIAVENNKRLKTMAEPSTHVGLQNLQHRYQLLSGQTVEINNLENIFSVKIPLLNPRPA